MDRDFLTTAPISRRRLLAGGALTGVAVFLAACGTKGTAATPVPSAPVAATGAPGTATGAPATAGATSAPSAVAVSPSAELNWANWTYYMDVDPNDQTKHPSLDGFTAKYGTKTAASTSVHRSQPCAITAVTKKTMRRLIEITYPRTR